MRAVVVIGPPGVGKTSVLTALHDLLTDDAVRHAVIEVEALGWSYPRLSDEQSFDHLRALRERYEAGGNPLLLCGATATSQSYLDRLLEVVGAADRLVVRLEADPATLRDRIAQREPPSWSGLPDLLAAASEIAAVSSRLRDVDLVVSTQETDALEVAAQIRAARPTLGP